jgi:hypothetical protein
MAQVSGVRNALLAVAALALGGIALPAHASFGDCNDSAYLALFDARLGTGSDFLCTESEHVPVASDAGTTHIRVIQHLVADWATAPGAMRSIKDGVAASAAAMPRLGSFRIPDVTILLVDGFGPASGGSEDFGDIAAETRFASADECRITLWLLGPGARASYAASVVAHELFHCVQAASTSRAQMFSYPRPGFPGGGAWWQEGSADWFSTLAVPAPRFLDDRVTAFDAHSPDTALDMMSYDAYVFFAWLGQTHGPEAVMPFLRSMASSASSGAQHAAMAAALPADDWLRFAEDYLDGRIRDGQGAPLHSTPQLGDTFVWDATRTQEIALQPFVLTRATLEFRCGRWRIEPRPARFHAVSVEGSDEWGPLPTSLDATTGDPPRFRFAGLAAATSPTRLRIAGTQESRCTECAGTRATDRCLVGIWELTRHGAEQWLREHGASVEFTRVDRVDDTMTLREDGTFSTGAARVSADARADEVSGTGRLAGHGSGRWSAEDGRLNLCSDDSAATGTLTVTMHGRSGTMPMATGGPGTMSNAYTCDAGTLRMAIPMGDGAVENVYRRVGAPAE